MPEVRALNAGSRSDRVVPVPGRSVSAVQCDLAGSLELRGIRVAWPLAFPVVEDAGRILAFLLFVDLLQYGGRQNGFGWAEQAESRLLFRHAREHQLVPARDRRLRSGQTNCPICRDFREAL